MTPNPNDGVCLVSANQAVPETLADKKIRTTLGKTKTLIVTDGTAITTVRDTY